MVVTARCATKEMDASASPRNPSVEMDSKSSNSRSLLVVCRSHRIAKSSRCGITHQDRPEYS